MRNACSTAILRILVGITCILIGVSACSKKETLLLRTAEYRTWEKTTPDILDYPIPGHEDKYRRIFISPEGNTPGITAKGGRTYYSFPAGTQIIKEILDPSWNGTDPPLMLTGMVKKPEDPRARGGWLWIVYVPKTGKEMVITEEFCITCHANANEPHPYGDKNRKNEFRDYVFFPPSVDSGPVKQDSSY